MTIPFNTRISRDFSRAAQTYDEAAVLQRKVADRLFKISGGQWGRVLDIGCGTGYFHELLRKNKIYQPLVQADIAIGMCKIAASYASSIDYGETYTCAADMHSLPFANKSFDNVFSSMTIQWALDVGNVFNEINRVLDGGGKFSLSIVAEGSLFELAEACTSAGYRSPVHKFLSCEEIESAIKSAGLSVHEIVQENIVINYEDIHAIINSFKKVGASYKGRHMGGIKGKGYFAAIEKSYRDKFAQEDLLPLSWNLVYVTGSK